MAFPRGPVRAPAPVRIRVAVFAVGRRVYIACAGDRSSGVTLTDDSGRTPVASLGDGTEVAIVAWQPGWVGNTRYRVRATVSGVEGWVGVGNLRSTEAAIASIPAAPAAPAVHSAAAFHAGEPTTSGRRFGQRF
jgi:hypothetical protein